MVAYTHFKWKRNIKCTSMLRIISESNGIMCKINYTWYSRLYDGEGKKTLRKRDESQMMQSTLKRIEHFCPFVFGNFIHHIFHNIFCLSLHYLNKISWKVRVKYISSLNFDCHTFDSWFKEKKLCYIWLIMLIFTRQWQE